MLSFKIPPENLSKLGKDVLMKVAVFVIFDARLHQPLRLRGGSESANSGGRGILGERSISPSSLPSLRQEGFFGFVRRGHPLVLDTQFREFSFC